MRTRISEFTRSYIEELEQAIREDPNFADEIVTIEDQLMTAKQAVELLKVDGHTVVAHRARQTRIK